MPLVNLLLIGAPPLLLLPMAWIVGFRQRRAMGIPFLGWRLRVNSWRNFEGRSSAIVTSR